MRIRFTRLRSLSIDEPQPVRKDTGFTLLELLVALTLAAIISLIISQVGTDSQRIYDSTITTLSAFSMIA